MVEEMKRDGRGDEEEMEEVLIAFRPTVTLYRASTCLK